MLYYRKDYDDGSFEIRFSKTEFLESGWYLIEEPNSSYSTWDEENGVWL